MILFRPSRAYVTVFVAAFVVAVLFAIFTQHVWEDYYITYRASKNLATGHGLVFNHGDRLHTFTSPLGVLLPALASLLTLNKSDAVALWIFRLMSAGAFAGAATLLFATLRRWQSGLAGAALGCALLALDAKSLDFTINGMETGFLLLFIAWTLWAQFGDCSRRWLWLGLGWAGLMWTRPDGFLYIGLLGVGGWLFNDVARTGLTRGGWLKTFLLAGLVCTAAYLPWFLFSWAYYGTPIPHTITAKSSVAAHHTLSGAFEMLYKLPVRIWAQDTSVPAAFLPSYYMIGGWAKFLPAVGKTLGTVAAFAWLIPFLRSPTRTASFAFFGLHVYLSYYPYFPFPWYLPGTAILGYVVIAGIFGQLIDRAAQPAAEPRGFVAIGAKYATWFVAGILVIGSASLTVAVARQVAAQQTWVEDGNRRKIGEWLHEHAEPKDTVFLEPLGYIGYFSNLKTYDFPGMSSREMVDSIQHNGPDWALLIDLLEPTWVVLRPNEVIRVNQANPDLLTTSYRLEREFDVRDAITKLSVPGRAYLEFDSKFSLFRRFRTQRFTVDAREVDTPYPPVATMVGTLGMRIFHAPSKIVLPVPPNAREFAVSYGLPETAYNAEPKTDGVTFEIKWIDGAHTEVLLSRRLNPALDPSHRGAQFFTFALPSPRGDARLVLNTATGPMADRDLSSWSVPEFH
jgi:hypothetical protein